MSIAHPIKYFGGKSYLAKQIISLMPPHTRYCEAFFGGGAVLFHKPCENVAEFVNDLNYELTNFWRTLGNANRFDYFYRAVQTIPLSRQEFEDASAPIHPECQGIRTELNRAVAFFVRYRQSRQGLAKEFCTPTKRLRRGMNENVSAWLSAVDGLPEAHARLRRVEIWNVDAVEFIRKLDSEETFFYCDPPYCHSTRAKSATDAYEYEMSDAQHESLLATLGSIKGKFILSGYRAPLYQERARVYGWRCIEIEIDNKSSGKKVKEKKTECLWLNY